MIQDSLEPEHLAVNFKQINQCVFISNQMTWHSISHFLNVQFMLGLIGILQSPLDKMPFHILGVNSSYL